MRPVGCRIRDVCFVHWPVEPDDLETRLPHALSVATREGSGWVTLLGMRTRPLVGPLGLPGEFSQVTVRTYVRAGDEEAVYFLRIDVDGWIVARVGRLFGVPIQHADASVDGGGEDVQVRTRSPGGAPVYDATFQRARTTDPVEEDPLIGWLTDRSTYALDDGRTGEVTHGPWTVAPVDAEVRANRILESEGLAARTGEALVRYSPGTDFRLRSWPSSGNGSPLGSADGFAD